MKADQSNPYFRALALGISVAAGISPTVHAAAIDKENNADNLNLASSWSGGVVPGSADIAYWTSLVAGANSTLLGADLSWQGLAIANPGGPVTIGGGNTLTLGRSGIDMSSAVQDLTIGANLNLGAGGQTWNVATGHALTLTGTLSRATGATVLIDRSVNTGTVTASPTLVNGVVPWTIVRSSGAAANNSANGSTFGTVTGGNIVAYTGATAFTTAAAAPPSSATTNYDWSSTGTATIGTSRLFNTIRYTGTGVTWNTNSGQTQTLNGFMNAGSGLVTIGGGTNTMNLQPAVGVNELVLAAANANITINGPIINNGANAAAVTVNGPNTVTFAGANTYTGGTNINSGKLVATSNGLNGGGIQITSGGTLTFTGNNQISTSTVTGGGAILNDTANTIILSGNHSGFTGTFTHNVGTNNTQFNSATAGSQDASYTLSAGELLFTANGDYTVKFGSLASATNQTIRGGNSATGITTLEVGNLNASTSLLGSLNNGATKVIALNKVGNGTLTLANATNSYSGGTTISAGTLLVNGTLGAAANAVALSGGATLAGTGTIAGAVSVAAGGTLVNGNGGTDDLALGGLSFAGAATINANYNGSTPPLAVTGTLATTPANGQVILNIAPTGPLATGPHNIISYGTFGGAATDFTANVTSGLNSRQSASLVLNGNNVALNVVGDTPKWTGAVNGNWTTNAIPGAKNWKLIAGNTATDFITGDNVLFDDSAGANTALELSNDNISAGLIEFNNGLTKPYSISSLNGFVLTAGTLIKNGTGSLTINTPFNTYSGGTTFNGGTLILNADDALGTGLITIGSGSAKVLNNLLGSPITLFSNPAQNWNDDFTFTGTNDIDMGTGTVTLGGDGTDRTVTTTAGTLTVGELKAAAHGFIKQGPGTLILTSTGAGAAASAISGTLDIAAGTLQINRTGGSGDAGSGDFTATGITGTGTITNGAAVDRWLFVNTAAASTFTGTLANGGTGGLGFNKQGIGNLTLAGANSYTGQTTVEGGTLTLPVANSGPGTGTVLTAGTLVMGHPSALGTAATIRLAGNNVSTLDLAHDGGGPTYGFIFATTTNATVISNRATPGAGLNHTLTTIGAAGVGGGTITFTSGANVTSGTGRVTFPEFGLAAGTVQATVLNPTTANVTVGNVSKVGATTINQTLELGGTSADNHVTGVISNGDGAALVSVTKSNSSTWTISNTNTYTGNTVVGTANGAGVLRATVSGALGAGTIVFDASGGTPGPTSRLELSNDITLANPITLHQRHNATPAIRNVSGNNTLSGAINLNVGGANGNIASDGGLLTLSGAISTTTTAARALHLGGDGNGLASNVISNGTGTVSVFKEGAGTWTLNGTNTYSGATTISGGILSISQDDVLADGAAVGVAATAFLNLSHGGTDIVDRFFINGVEQVAGTWGSLTSTATNKTARITGTGILQATNGAPVGGYSGWATSFGLNPLTDGAAGVDKELDGFENGTEYILGGSPISGSNNPKIYSLIADGSVDGDSTNELIMTIAVPVGTPAFSAGAPTSTATFEGFGIAVRGSTTLTSFPVPVTPVAPVVTGLPAAPVQGGITYEYRSFSLGGSNGTTGKGFLQVTVTNP